MIVKVLVANRGEIACRVARTCREAGIATVAVYSDPDADSVHVREADEAVRLPGAAPAETYLRGDLLVAAALATGADAVHPGYGFLSENAEFAAAVTAAGLTWIGPPAEAIHVMGSKTRAKGLMAAAGVPVLDGAGARPPLLVKAAAGGGGRGMRIVRDPETLQEELAAARAEARAAFGDGEVFVEPYVEHGRHVEVQVLADAHGTVWTLGTRDCSVQRRHQKVVEESPAPGLSDLTLRQLAAYAGSAARVVDYVGAGTVEFLVDKDGSAYFLEMNTRLQVEHPVTEAVFGLDLVREQIRIAEGVALPSVPPPPRGHAVEVRLYAEDPAREWRPSTGTLHRFAVPGGPGVRVDTGVADGSRIGTHYDAMLAKVVAHAPTRPEALRLLAGVLERSRVHGPVTNRELLVRILRDPGFAAGGVSTAFLDGFPLAAMPDEEAVRLSALAAALADAAGRHPAGGWRNVPSQPQCKRFRERSADADLTVRYVPGRDGVTAPDLPGVTPLHRSPDAVVLESGGVRREFAVSRYGDEVFVDSSLGALALTALPRFPDARSRTAPGSLLAPMPGTVTRTAGLPAGSTVAAGQPLVWLEAMKMEHRITAPASGTLTAALPALGTRVEVGTVLAVVERGEGSP